MAKDWRSGKLLGAKYAVVSEDKAYIVSDTKENLRATWARSAERLGLVNELPESLIKQVVIVLPPWEGE